MVILREEAFKFTWHFDNFSMCPQQFGKGIYSPVFVANSMQKTEWRLCLYPRGSESTNHIACFLERTEDGDYVGDITTGIHLKIISGHNVRNIRQRFGKCIFRRNDSWGCDDLCIRDDIFDSTHGLLPNDTLTIECQLRRFVQETESALSDSVICLISKDYSQTDQYSALTRIKVRSKSVLWPIARFRSLQPNEKFIKTVASDQADAPSFNLTLYLNRESKAVIEIRLSNQITKTVFVRCRIKTVGDARSQHQAEAEHLFDGEKNDAWQFPVFIKRGELKETGYLHRTNDVLYLYCEFFCSVEGEEYSVEDFNAKQTLYSQIDRLHSSRRSYRQLYLDGTFNDVTIAVGKEKFKVHRSIPSAGSSIVSSMLKSDICKEGNDIMEIFDFDADTMAQLLILTYAYELENLSQEDIDKLYASDKKYEVLPLKYRCYAVS